MKAVQKTVISIETFRRSLPLQKDQLFLDRIVTASHVTHKNILQLLDKATLELVSDPDAVQWNLRRIDIDSILDIRFLKFPNVLQNNNKAVTEAPSKGSKKFFKNF